MSNNRSEIEKRVVRAAEEALHRKNYVCIIDVFVGMSLLKPVQVTDWQKGRIPYLERVIQGNLSKVSFAIKCFHRWAAAKGLKKSETVYLARTNGPKRNLQFSMSGSAHVEKMYQTHYVSPLLSEIKQQKLKEKLSEPPELVVFWLINETKCSTCAKELGSGNFLFKEGDQPLCLFCAGLGELVFLPSGDPKVTRQAKKQSAKYAVVVKFSRSRGRYERQGLLVQPEALNSEIGSPE